MLVEWQLITLDSSVFTAMLMLNAQQKRTVAKAPRILIVLSKIFQFHDFLKLTY